MKRVVIGLLAVFAMMLMMSCAVKSAEGGEEEEPLMSSDELQHMLNNAVIRACPEMRKGVKHVAHLCKRMEDKALSSEGVMKATSSKLSKSSKSPRVSTIDLSIIKSGYGYSVMDHEVKLPIIKSMNVKELETPIIDTKEMQFKSPRGFFNHVYNLNASTLSAILYSDTLESARHTFNKLFKSKTEIHAIDTKYVYYTVGSDRNLTFTDDFKRIYRLLPRKYNYSIYKMIIKYFGERVMTETLYGGIVGQTNIVRSCYPRESAVHYAGLSFQNFIQSSNSTENLSIPATFLKYSNIAARDIIGGNPEVSKVNRRIKTFAKNPAPIKFRTVPIWEAMPEGSYQRRNLKIAYEKYIQEAISKKERQIEQLENMKTKQSARPILLKVFLQQNPCGYQDLTRNVCKAKNNGIHCPSRGSRQACTGLINKSKDIMLRRSTAPKLLTSECVGVMGLFGVTRGLPECSYKGKLKLFATRDENDEIQLEMKYAYYRADNYDYYDSDYGPNYVYQEESLYVSEKRKQGGCITVHSTKFSQEIYGLGSVKWKVCFNCQPQIAKDHYSFECSCPYLMK